jgi:hypothetical protein
MNFYEHSVRLTQNPELAEQAITAENKDHYRPILQWLGGYAVKKVSPTVWYDEIVRRIQAAQHGGAELSVVGGVRFPADAEVLRTTGATIVDILRPDVPAADIHKQSAHYIGSTNLTDPTERYRSRITYDTRILNNGTVEDLQALAPTFLNDLRSDNVRSLYIASHTA